MCMMSSPKTQPLPPPPEMPPVAPDKADARVKAARDDEKKRIKAMAGAASTNKTGGMGLTDQANTSKTKLGQ